MALTRIPVVAASALLLGLLLGGCGGDDEPTTVPSSGKVAGTVRVEATKKIVDARSYGQGISVCEVDALSGKFVVVTDAKGKEVGRAHIPSQGEADVPDKPKPSSGGVPGTCTFEFATQITGPKDAGPFTLQIEGRQESVTYDPGKPSANEIVVDDLAGSS